MCSFRSERKLVIPKVLQVHLQKVSITSCRDQYLFASNQNEVVLPMEQFKREKADIQPTKDLYAEKKLFTKRVSK
jgi:hypothetical protein